MIQSQILATYLTEQRKEVDGYETGRLKEKSQVFSLANCKNGLQWKINEFEGKVEFRFTYIKKQLELRINLTLSVWPVCTSLLGACLI